MKERKREGQKEMNRERENGRKDSKKGKENKDGRMVE